MARMITDTYTRTVTEPEVLDGDTFRCVVDLGFYVHVRMSCRVAGINAPELHEPGGPQAKATLEALLKGASSISVVSVKPDKYAGRFDAVVWINDTINIGEYLISQGLAVRWDGTGPRPHVPWPP